MLQKYFPETNSHFASDVSLIAFGNAEFFEKSFSYPLFNLMVDLEMN
jgi:hypothetical protein